MKVIVCGGRDYSNTSNVFSTLDAIHAVTPITHVIQGGAPGADSSGAGWALVNGAQNVQCPANWALYGKGAGPIRNAAMLKLNPDLVVAFPGGTGTADMITQATAAGIALKVLNT